MKNRVAGTFRSLRSFNFRLWTAGALVSNIGTWMQRVAQDWLVLTQLTHHDASALGIVMGLQFAPQLLLLPWTGSAADRLNQRKLLMLTQATMGVLALILGVLTIAGVIRLWHVYVFAFLSGSAAALDAPVRQTFVAEMVGDEDLTNAVALNSTSFNAAQMIGPAVAGLLIAKRWHRMGLSSERALIRGSSDLDVVLSSLGTARKRQSASHYIWISGRASLRLEKTGPQGDPDHVVSDRHLWPELSHLHLYDGRERLPLRRTRFRPALLHHGRGHSLGALFAARPEKPA
jgi:MFS family permease